MGAGGPVAAGGGGCQKLALGHPGTAAPGDLAHDRGEAQEEHHAQAGQGALQGGPNIRSVNSSRCVPDSIQVVAPGLQQLT